MNKDSIVKLQKELKPGTRLQIAGETKGTPELENGDKGTVVSVSNSGKILLRMDNGLDIEIDPEKTKTKRLAIDDQIQEAEVIKNNNVKGKSRSKEKVQNEIEV